MSISVTDGLTARSASSAEENSRSAGKSGKILWRRFGFGTQNDAGLAAPKERGERTVVPVAHRGGVVLVEASELERFTIEFF
jgi:hypothetical protein